MTRQNSSSLGRTALTMLIGIWGVSPVACGGRSSALEGGFTEGGLGSSAGGVDSFGGNPTGPGGTPSSGGATGAGGAFSQGGRFGAGGALPTGGTFASGGAIGGAVGKGGRGGKAGFGGKGATGGSDGGFAGADPGGSAGWAGAGGTGGDLCAPNTGFDVYVDPIEGNDVFVQDITPTGVLHPPYCRYKSLTHALSRVAAGGRVMAVSDGAPQTVTFKSETFPLTVPPNVSLVGSTRLPDRFQIAFTSAGTTAVVLQDGSNLEGFTIHNRGGGSGTFVSCNGQHNVTLSSVNLEGNARISVGASLGCAANVSLLNVNGADVGLEVPGSPNLPNVVSVQGANIIDCTVGIQTWGTLYASALYLADIGDGIVVNSGEANVWESSIGPSALGRAAAPRGNGVVVGTSGKATLSTSSIARNAGAGVYVDGASLILVDSNVFDNGGLAGVRPTGSGVYVRSATEVTLITTSIFQNAVHGLHLPSEGAVGLLHFESSMLAGNGQSGARIDGLSSIGLSAVSSTFTENAISGLVFNRGVSLLEPFYGNRFASNLVSQLAFNAASPAGTWRLGSSQPGCTQPNLVSCYGGSSVGVVAAAGAAVDAGYVRWHNVPPVAGQDFVGPISVHDTCGTSALCDF